MLTFPWGAVSICIDRATNRKRSKGRDADGSKTSSPKPQKKETEKQRRTPCRSVPLDLWCVASFPPGTDTKATNKEELTPTVRSMDRLFGRDEQKKAKTKQKKESTQC